ncbi:MAG: hypothetical protein RIE53_13690 [Rhodothermales bacterium]
MKPNSSRVKKWKRWLDKSVVEVGRLRTFIEVRRDFMAVVDQSPIKNRKDAFWTFIGFAMVDELVIRAVRICERQGRGEKRVHSLRALLEECAEYYGYFTRKRFVGRVHPPKEENDDLDTEGPHPVSARYEFDTRNYVFDSVVGAGKSGLSKGEIDVDIARLDAAIDELQKFRNKFIAHNDFRRGTRKAPSLSKIPDSVEVISQITRKYYQLITRNDIALGSYIFHTDITQLFDQAWILSCAILTYGHKKPVGLSCI